MSKIYSLGELIDNEYEEPPVIVEDLIWKGQNVLIIADAKVGKSVLLQQLALAISSGTPFLDKFEVPLQQKVLYVQAEGTIYETSSRIKRMVKEVDHDRNKLKWYYTPTLPMDREDSVEKFVDRVAQTVDEDGKPFKPDVIIFDPLYPMATTGSLTADDVGTRIVNNLNSLKDYYDSTNILIHHQHRSKRNDRGETIHEGDDAYFGSYVFKAWPDTMLHMAKKKGKGSEFKRTLSCGTQRSGKTSSSIELEMIQPDPLLFWIDDLKPAWEEKLLHFLEGSVPQDEVMIDNYLRKQYTKKEMKPKTAQVLKLLKKLEFTGKIERIEGGYILTQKETEIDG